MCVLCYLFALSGWLPWHGVVMCKHARSWGFVERTRRGGRDGMLVGVLSFLGFRGAVGPHTFCLLVVAAGVALCRGMFVVQPRWRM